MAGEANEDASRGDDIAAAIESLGGDETSGPGTDASGSIAGPETKGDDRSGGDGKPADDVSEKKGDADESAGKPAEGDGKPAAKADGKPAPKEEKPAPGAKKDPAKSADGKPDDKKAAGEKDDASRRNRAPGTWKAPAREKWAEVPVEAQQEILRREAEVTRALTASSNARKFHEGFGNMMSQYQSIVAAEGGNAMQYVSNLLTTAAGLYNGAPAQKVQIIGDLIRNFGVDIQGLDDYLSDPKNRGAARTSANAGTQDVGTLIKNAVQQTLAPYIQGRDSAEQAALDEELEAFATNPENEFFDDVKNDMADLMEMAARRKQKMTLQEAYNRATMMHNDIAEIVSDRQIRKKAADASAAAAAAKAKDVSLTGAPSKAGPEGRDSSSSERRRSVRDDRAADVAAAFDQHAGS